MVRMGSSFASRVSVVEVQFAGADWLESAAWEFDVCAQSEPEQKYAGIASRTIRLIIAGREERRREKRPRRLDGATAVRCRSSLVVRVCMSIGSFDSFCDSQDHKKRTPKNRTSVSELGALEPSVGQRISCGYATASQKVMNSQVLRGSCSRVLFVREKLK